MIGHAKVKQKQTLNLLNASYNIDLSFARFLVGNIRNRMLQTYATLVRGVTYFQNV